MNRSSVLERGRDAFGYVDIFLCLVQREVLEMQRGPVLCFDSGNIVFSRFVAGGWLWELRRPSS